jgi:hypothetical protein
VPSESETVSVYSVNLPQEGLQDIVGILPESVVFQRGLPREAVVGKLRKRAIDGGTVSPDNFARNTVFVEFLHQVIGAFTVEAGVIVGGSYTRNPNHSILSANGFFRLEPSLHQILVREISALA